MTDLSPFAALVPQDHGLVTVSMGGSRKLANIRRDPRITVVVRAGWLLREVFRAAGGTHDDWDEYDRVMAQDRRAAVFVTAKRVYTPG